MASIPIARYPSVSEMGYSPLGSFLEGGLSGFQTGYGLKRDIVDRKRKKELEDQRMQMQQEELGVRKKESEARVKSNELRESERIDEKDYRRNRDALMDERNAAREEAMNQQRIFNNSIRKGDFDRRKTSEGIGMLESSREKLADAEIALVESDTTMTPNKIRTHLNKFMKSNPGTEPYLASYLKQLKFGLKQQSTAISKIKQKAISHYKKKFKGSDKLSGAIDSLMLMSDEELKQAGF